MRNTSAVRALLAGIAGTALITTAAVSYESCRDYRDDFLCRKGELATAVEHPAGGDSLSAKQWLSLTSTSGLRVECGMLLPRGNRGRHPAIILLGGKATGKHAVDYALDIRDVVIVAVDYPFEPRESYTVPEILSDIPAVRRALLDMPPSVMLVLDYLAQRPDVDRNRIVLLGYSFGAPLVPVIAALDRRPAVAALVYGGGDLRSLIRHNVRRYEGPLLSEILAAAGSLLLRPLEPLRYAEAISPTPLLMINGTEDEQVPAENARLLFAAAKEPKKIVWLDSRHVHPRDIELTRRIIRTLTEELRVRGVLVEKNPP